MALEWQHWTETGPLCLFQYLRLFHVAVRKSAQMQSLHLLHRRQWNLLRTSPNSRSVPVPLWAPAHPSTSSIHLSSTPLGAFLPLLPTFTVLQVLWAEFKILKLSFLKIPFRKGVGAVKLMWQMSNTKSSPTWFLFSCFSF